MLIAALLFVVGVVAANVALSIEVSLLQNAPPIGLLVSPLMILEIFLVVGAIFLRASYDVIGTRLGAQRFKKTGPLILIGLGLTIAFGLGFGLLVLGAAAIMQIAAFFSLPDQISIMSPNWTPER
jgi:uncharacterized membrane protein